jgi:hypothetical protein
MWLVRVHASAQQKTVSYFVTMVHLWLLVPQSERTGMARGRPADKPELARELQIERGSMKHRLALGLLE